MRIANNNQTSFGAKFINKTKIGQIIEKNNPKYQNKTVSFVKINPSNSQDIDALYLTSKYWDGDKFAKNIYYAACALRNESKYYKNHEIYALTAQSHGFENPDGDMILGLVHTSPYLDTPVFIEHIQVNPDFLKEKSPKYKGIGTAILNSLKLLSNKITCFPESEKSVKDFYIKNGFVKHPNIPNYYVWEKQ